MFLICVVSEVSAVFDVYDVLDVSDFGDVDSYLSDCLVSHILFLCLFNVFGFV